MIQPVKVPRAKTGGLRVTSRTSGRRRKGPSVL